MSSGPAPGAGSGGFAEQLAGRLRLEPEAAVDHVVSDVRRLPTARLGSPDGGVPRPV
ncbi:hypothetical protein [Streptomyces humi]|uniref:hypothetical protein n=1 Tax=Streptomyces humi TaxID=1428620 RepID=UPI00142E027B|nr:hypothetical protein [Streptomyces humi]